MLEDVLGGYCSADHARRVYGVAIGLDAETVDPAATENCAAMRKPNRGRAKRPLAHGKPGAAGPGAMVPTHSVNLIPAALALVTLTPRPFIGRSGVAQGAAFPQPGIFFSKKGGFWNIKPDKDDRYLREGESHDSHVTSSRP
ncbi:hypothetical protein [Paracoccus versutus]|uniref:hypothetical protein n=1 Tax=Paracoccus versutus TaxID=34007 RepID=UPI001FB67861|nr:hypothetical protein [Paracoccus versutus]